MPTSGTINRKMKLRIPPHGTIENWLLLFLLLKTHEDAKQHPNRPEVMPASCNAKNAREGIQGMLACEIAGDQWYS